jgi:hypothetical protein
LYYVLSHVLFTIWENSEFLKFLMSKRFKIWENLECLKFLMSKRFTIWENLECLKFLMSKRFKIWENLEFLKFLMSKRFTIWENLEFLKFLMSKRFTQVLRNTSDATEEQVAMIFHSLNDNKQTIFLPLRTKSPCHSTSFRSFCISRSFAAPERRKLVVFLVASPVHNAQCYYMPKLPTSSSLCYLSQYFFRLISSTAHAVV